MRACDTVLERGILFAVQSLPNMVLIWTHAAKGKQSQWGYDFEHVERSVSACIDHGERVDESAKKSIRTRTGRRMPTHREANTVLMSHKNLLVRFVRKDDDYLIIDVIFTGLSKADMDTYAKAGVDAAFINGLDGIVATGLEA